METFPTKGDSYGKSQRLTGVLSLSVRVESLGQLSENPSLVTVDIVALGESLLL